MDRRSNYGILSRKWCEQENEFLAENEMISIIPNFSHGKLDFIFGSIGPFKPNVRIEVPIWLAIELHKSKKCKVLLPLWLNIQTLSEALKNERDDTSQNLSQMPFHYSQIVKLLANNEIIEFSQLDEINKRLKDIEEIRSGKISNGIKSISTNLGSVGLKNITSSELSYVHSGILHVLDVYEKLLGDKNDNILNNTQSQTQSSQFSPSTNHNSNLRSNMSTKFISTHSNFSQTTHNTNQKFYSRDEDDDNDDQKTSSPYPNKRISFQSPHSSILSGNNNDNNDDVDDFGDLDSNKENEDISNFDNMLDSARSSRKLQRKSKNKNDDNPQGLPPKKIRRLRH